MTVREFKGPLKGDEIAACALRCATLVERTSPQLFDALDELRKLVERDPGAAQTAARRLGCASGAIGEALHATRPAARVRRRA